MGFFSDAGGFLKKNLYGGLLDTGEESRTTKTTSDTTTDQEGLQERILRDQTPEEAQRLALAGDELQSLMAGMSPEEQAALNEQNYRNIYDPAAAAIGQSYDTRGAQQYSLSSRVAG